MRRSGQTERGFTLAELLIVVAIIAVLTAVSVPLFGNQLEKARQATDLSNMRAAYAAAEYAYLLDEQPLSGYYDAASGQLTESVPMGYGQSTKDVTDFFEVLPYASGVPNADGMANAIRATVNESGQVSLVWGGGTGAVYRAAASRWSSLSVSELKNPETAQERQAADVDGLQKLADSFIGMTKSELKELYSDANDGDINNMFGGGGVLFSFNLDTANSRRISYKSAAKALEIMGYEGEMPEMKYGSGVERGYLSSNAFFSDYMNTNTSSDIQIKVQLKTDKTTGEVVSAHVWANPLDKSMGDNELKTGVTATAD